MLPSELAKLQYRFIEGTNSELIAQQLSQMDKQGWEFVAMTASYPTTIVLLRRKNGATKETGGEENPANATKPTIAKQVPEDFKGAVAAAGEENTAAETLTPTESERGQEEKPA